MEKNKEGDIMCLICKRIDMIKVGENHYAVSELETGYVVLGDQQRFSGYTLFLCKHHVTDLHFWKKKLCDKYLSEMADVSEAVAEAFDAEKMNVESLGNGDAHLLFHGFPSCAGDLGSYGHNGRGPVWCLPFEERYASSVR